MLSRANWHTSDIGEAAGAFSGTFGKTRIEVLESSSSLDVQFDVISLGSCSLIRNRLGPKVDLFAEETKDYLHTVARKGHTTFSFDGKVFRCDRRRGTMLSPVRNLRVSRSRGSENTILKMNREAVHGTLASLVGKKIDDPVVFEPEVNVHSGAGASMRRLMEHVFDEVSRGDTGMAIPQVAAATSRALITDALFLLRHDYSDMLTSQPEKHLMPLIRCVEEFIEGEHRRKVSDAMLADVSGKSPSTIYRAFMKHRGYTPMQYLRMVRMRAARKGLLSSGPDDSVTSIALDCGFMHLSRFAGDYRRQYGEKPSETLRRSKLA